MIHKPNYCLLDASRMNDAVYKAKELNEEHHCLYEGESAKFLNSVAPFLFSFSVSSPFSDWLFDEGQGKSWGILLTSSVEPLQVYRHLRKFLIIQTEEDRELYFRYYDPRVLSVFLPTCDSEQLHEFFGPIETFIAEDDNGRYTAFSLIDGVLSLDDKVEFEEKEEEFSSHDDEVSDETPDDKVEEPAQKSGNVRWDFGY